MFDPFVQYGKWILGIAVSILLFPVGSLAQVHHPYQGDDSVHVHQIVAGTSTPEEPPPPSGGGGGGPIPDNDEPFGPVQLAIGDIDISTSETSAVVSWTTTLPAFGSLSWGETTWYERGEIVGVEVLEEHRVLIENLVPGTQYAVMITTETSDGKSAEVSGILFRTDRLPDTTPPANVSDFTALYNTEDAQVDFSWGNPSDTDFARVRIVRSDIFYPEDPYAGIVVYEGRKEQASDTWVEEGVTYYYAVFAEDVSGNYASGALAHVKIPKTGGEGEGAPDEEELPWHGPAVIYPEDGEAPEEINTLTFEDFLFFQGDREVERNRNSISIEGGSNTSIMLPYEDVPEVLKTITLVFEDPFDPSKTFPFLLRVNEEKTAYTATIGPLRNPGMYRVTAMVLDYKHQVLKEIRGKVIVPGVYAEEDWTVWVCEYCALPATLARFLHCYGWIPFLVIAIIIRMIQRRKKKVRYSEH
jgi:hypothetical protein